MEAEYFINRKGKTLGPFSMLQIRNLANIGKIYRTDQIKKKGGPWTLANNIKGLLQPTNNQTTETCISKCEICGTFFQNNNPLETSEEICPGCELSSENSTKTNGKYSAFLDPITTIDSRLTPKHEIPRRKANWKSWAVTLAILCALVLSVVSFKFYAIYQQEKSDEDLSKINDSIDISAIVGKWEGQSRIFIFFQTILIN